MIGGNDRSDLQRDDSAAVQSDRIDVCRVDVPYRSIVPYSMGMHWPDCERTEKSLGFVNGPAIQFC